MVGYHTFCMEEAKQNKGNTAIATFMKSPYCRAKNTAKLWLSQVNYIYTSEYMWHKNFRATFSKKISPPKT